MKMEKTWLKKRQEEVLNKRQEEEMINFVSDWSHAKSRVEKELTRKIDSQAYGSNYKECEYKPKQYTKKEMLKFEKTIVFDENSYRKDPSHVVTEEA